VHDPTSLLASDSKAVTDSLFPDVVGNRPVQVQARYPQPVPIEGEAEADAFRMPVTVTTHWIRGQVDDQAWQAHWKFGGRITPAMIKEFYDGLVRGYSQTAIKRRLGISDTTWSQWRERSKEGHEPQALFTRVVESGLGNIEAKVIDAWVSKVPEDWRAAEGFLKSRFPQDWNPAVQVDVSHQGTVTHEGKLSLDDADLLAVAEILRATGVLSDVDGEVIDAQVVDDIDGSNR
jgi:hypothetical protein